MRWQKFVSRIYNTLRHTVSQSNTRLHKVSQYHTYSITRLHKVSHSITRHHKVSHSITRHCKLAQSITRYHKVSQSITKVSLSTSQYRTVSQQKIAKSDCVCMGKRWWMNIGAQNWKQSELSLWFLTTYPMVIGYLLKTIVFRLPF